MKKCPRCHVGKLSKGAIEHTSKVAGIAFTATVPAEVCDACDRSTVHVDDIERFELTVAAKLVALGVHTGEAFRYARKALGLSGVEVGKLLGIAPETISRWEHGEPHEFACVLLGGMAADALAGRRETADRLRALAEPSKAKRVVIEVDFAAKRVEPAEPEEERRPPARSGAMPIKEPARGRKKHAG